MIQRSAGVLRNSTSVYGQVQATVLAAIPDDPDLAVTQAEIARRLPHELHHRLPKILHDLTKARRVLARTVPRRSKTGPSAVRAYWRTNRD